MGRTAGKYSYFWVFQYSGRSWLSPPPPLPGQEAHKNTHLKRLTKIFFFFPADHTLFDFVFIGDVVWRRSVACRLDCGLNLWVQVWSSVIICGRCRIGVDQWPLLSLSLRMQLSVSVTPKLFYNCHNTSFYRWVGRSVINPCCYATNVSCQSIDPACVVRHHFSASASTRPCVTKGFPSCFTSFNLSYLSSSSIHIDSSCVTLFEQNGHVCKLGFSPGAATNSISARFNFPSLSAILESPVMLPSVGRNSCEKQNTIENVRGHGRCSGLFPSKKDCKEAKNRSRNFLTAAWCTLILRCDG